MTTITVSARTHSLVLTKSFASKASIFGSDEYKMLQEARRDYPGYKVTVGKSKNKEQKNAFTGLDYKYMREYIQKHDDEQHSKMEKFKTLIAQDKKDGKEDTEHLEAAGYLDVRAWFLATFPEIKKSRENHKEKVQAILAEVA